MKFAEYLRSKRGLRENKLNEATPTEATEIDFGLFSWGGGGELETIGAVALAASLVAMKGIYNGVVYAKLKAKLPAYIKEYKITQPTKAKDLWEEKYDEQNIAPLQKKKRELAGDEDSRSSKGKEGKSPKEILRGRFQLAIDKLGNTEEERKRKEVLRQKRDSAVQQIDLKIQQISDQIEKLEAKKDVEWENELEKWRQYSEKFDEEEDSFVEVANSVLASSWKKRWENEFTIAKKKADIEVLEEALKHAAKVKNEKEIDEITNSKRRAEAMMARAEDAMSEVDEDSGSAAETQQANAGEFGITEFIGAQMSFGKLLLDKQKEWSSLESQEQKADSEESDQKKEELEKKIQEAKEKVQKAKEKFQEIQDKGDATDEQQEKMRQQIENAEKKIADWEEELSKIGESGSSSLFYSMLNRVNEVLQRFVPIFEEESAEQKPPSFAKVRKSMAKSIENAPEEDKKNLLNSAISDIEKIKSAKETAIEAQNSMVEKIQSELDKEEEDRKEFPKGFEAFKKIKKIEEPQEELKEYVEAIDSFVEQGGEKPSKKDEETPTSDESPEVEEKPDSTEPSEPEESEEEKELKKDIQDHIVTGKQIGRAHV